MWRPPVDPSMEPARNHRRTGSAYHDARQSNPCQYRYQQRQPPQAYHFYPGRLSICKPALTTVTVCHYPTGWSKWNPIEHRLFGPISLTWAGYPLRTWELMLAYLRATTTTTGLEVQAIRLDGDYQTGLRVSDLEMAALNLTAHAVCPAWNYTLRPRADASPALPVGTLERLAE